MKALAITGSPRKGGTGDEIVARIRQSIPDLEVINLREKSIKQCLGCQVCYQKGDKACPLKDDVQDILSRMLAADCVIFISPVYTLDISGQMKVFFDRLSFVCHRPLFYEKHAMLVAYAAVFGTSHTMKTLELVAGMWEFGIASKVEILNMNQKFCDKHNRLLDSGCMRLKAACAKGPKSPGLMSLVAFQLRKKGFMEPHPGSRYEHDFWEEHGWLEKDRDFYSEEKQGIKGMIARLVASTIMRLPS